MGCRHRHMCESISTRCDMEGTHNRARNLSLRKYESKIGQRMFEDRTNGTGSRNERRHRKGRARSGGINLGDLLQAHGVDSPLCSSVSSSSSDESSLEDVRESAATRNLRNQKTVKIRNFAAPSGHLLFG